MACYLTWDEDCRIKKFDAAEDSQSPLRKLSFGNLCVYSSQEKGFIFEQI